MGERERVVGMEGKWRRGNGPSGIWHGMIWVRWRQRDI